MDWNSNVIKSLWPSTINNRESKEQLAAEIADKVKNGDIIGVGSGSTSYVALLAIAQKIKSDNLIIKAIPTSIEMALTCKYLDIPITTLNEHIPNWSFDGADEVDKNKHLIKGRGGAMFQEKLIMSISKRNYIIVDNSKLVERLGHKFPVPVEVYPPALMCVESKLIKLGATEISLRPAQGKDGPVISENGNLILDVRFENIDENMEKEIKSITGVIESGLFQNHEADIIVAR